MSAPDGLRVTWWGHATASVDLAGVRVLTDPLLVGRLAHLRRHTPTPAPAAREADLVLVSHLHADHLHLPSLARVDAAASVVVPRGAGPLVRGPGAPRREVHEVDPGDVLEVAGCVVRVLEAHHDGRRLPWSRRRGPALGFRVDRAGRSFWFPGDTGPGPDFAAAGPVDLALVPVGGWGPSLGPEHLDPAQAADAVAAARAAAAVPVHWGTFWPTGLERVAPGVHHRLFVTPGERFVAALGDRARGLLLTPGETRAVRA